MTKIYANLRKDGTRMFLGKQDFGFIYGDSTTGAFKCCQKLAEYKKATGNSPTHSLIVENIKAKRILEALPFMLSKNSMDTVFELAENM